MTKLELRLDRLECHVQGDASGGSEPYLWPMLIWVSDQTLGTPALVRSNHPHTPRTVLGQDVRAGAVLSVPSGAGTVATNLVAGDSLRRALVIVGLLENDETPDHVVRVAYDSFTRELPAAIARHLLDLSSNDPVTVEAAKEAVRTEVGGAVESAGSGEMTTWEKIKVGVGSLNLDDQVGSAFTDVSAPASGVATTPLALRYTETKDNGSVTTQDWTLTGSLTVDTRIDLCAGLVLASNQARVRRDGLRRQLLDLRTAWGQARGAEREAIALDIAETQDALAQAESELSGAEAALAACRASGGGRRPPIGGLGDVVIVASDHVRPS
jgi:hypothetical protein